MKTIFNIFSKGAGQSKHKVKPKVIADLHEKNSLVISELISLRIDVDFQHLKIGDYLVKGAVVERKTISDFMSSMVNGRLVNQLEELKQYENKLLLIEGLDEQELYTDSADRGGIHPNSIRGFLLSIVLKHKVPVIFTKNYADTARFISVLSKRKETELPLNARKKSLSDKETMQFVIESFPGIGPKTAKKLLKKFGTIKNIINARKDKLKAEIGKKAESVNKIVNKKY